MWKGFFDMKATSSAAHGTTTLLPTIRQRKAQLSFIPTLKKPRTFGQDRTRDNKHNDQHHATTAPLGGGGYSHGSLWCGACDGACTSENPFFTLKNV